MKILFVTRWLPYPPISGNPIRNFNIIKRLAKNHEVWVASFTEGSTNPEDISGLEKYCFKVIPVDYTEHSAIYAPIKGLKFLLTGTPPDLRLNESTLMSEKIHHLTKEIDFDIIQIEDSFMALYLSAVYPKPKTLTLISLHDIGFHKYKRIYKLEPKLTRKLRLWVHSQMMRIWEPKYIQKFSGCITMSDLDKNRLWAQNPKLTITSIPNGIDIDQFQLLPEPDHSKFHLLFVGNLDYLPNQDSILYFCQEIFPRLIKLMPFIELWIVGKNPPDTISSLANESIHVTGIVEDVQPYYEKTSISIVPLRAGGGTRLKILESFALGRPVISTTIGCEGLNVSDGEQLLIADTKDEFINKIQQIYNDKKLYNQLYINGRKFVEENYGWDLIVKKLENYYLELQDKFHEQV